MFETIQFPYSKNSAIFGVALPLVFFTITYSNLKMSLYASAVISYSIILFADLVFLALMAYVFIKRLIPALKNDIALELNNDGIADYIRNVMIDWTDVKSINLLPGRNFSKLIVNLKQETDYGTEIAISLRWIKGKDKEIYQTALAYFEEIKEAS